MKLPFALALVILLSACDRQNPKAPAIEETRLALISYITDLEGGMTPDQFDKHFSELKLIYQQHEQQFTPAQRAGFLVVQGSAENLQYALHLAGPTTRVKSDPRLLSLSPDQITQLTKLDGPQITLSRTAANAAEKSKKLLASITAP